MASIILDCDLMKSPNSGLYHYCKNLWKSVNEELIRTDKEPLIGYVPDKETRSLLGKERTYLEETWHRWLPTYLWGCKVWHAPFQSGRVISKKGLFRDTKIVLTVHDLNVLHEDKSQEDVQKSLTHTQKLIDQSDRIVCISEFAKKDLLTHCDTNSKKVEVIYNGLNTLLTPCLRPSTYEPRLPFVFGIGYVNRKKNFHVLLELAKARTDLEIVVAGKFDDPDYISSILTIVTKEGLTNRFHLIGPISENEKTWYYQNCTAFAHPSLAEGFGLPVLEAMSLGKPVFCSNRTSLPEIGGEFAFYWDSFTQESMVKVFEEGMKRAKDKDWEVGLRSHAHQFCWRKAARSYLSVYQELL